MQNNNEPNMNWWFIIAVLEFLILIFLFLKLLSKGNTKRRKLKRRSLKEEVNFDNIINSSFNSNKLYDKLKVKCHPDRFLDDKNRNKIANELFQKISENKNNAENLLHLKEEAIRKLKIKL